MKLAMSNLYGGRYTCNDNYVVEVHGFLDAKHKNEVLLTLDFVGDVLFVNNNGRVQEFALYDDDDNKPLPERLDGKEERPWCDVFDRLLRT